MAGARAFSAVNCHDNAHLMSLPSYPSDVELTRALEASAPTFSALHPRSLASPSKSSSATAINDLDWEHELRLIGKKVSNPMLHSCDVCRLPILTYGRLKPCHHALCYACATTVCQEKCVRCGQKVVKVKRIRLGSVFMCTFKGSRYGHDGCRRTYISQRDLNAHLQHRHGAKLLEESSADHSINENAALKSAENIDFVKSNERLSNLLETSAMASNFRVTNESLQGSPHLAPFPKDLDHVALPSGNAIPTTPTQLPNLSQPPPSFFSEPQQGYGYVSSLTSSLNLTSGAHQTHLYGCPP